MKIKRVLYSLLSLLMCFGCFLGNVRANDITPEDEGYKVTKLTLGKKHSDKDVDFNKKMYSFSVSEAGVVNVKVVLKDSIYSTYKYYCHGKIENKKNWGDVTFFNYSMDSWKCERDKATFNVNYYLEKGTYYVLLDSYYIGTYPDIEVDDVSITVTKKDSSDFTVKTNKLTVKNVPSRSSDYAKTVKYVDEKAIPSVNIKYFYSDNYGYDFKGVTYYNKKTKEWLYYDYIEKEYVWLTSNKANKDKDRYEKRQDSSIIYGSSFCDSKLTEAGANISYYTKWSAKKYKVVYKANGGTGVMGNSTFRYDQTYNLKNNTFEHKTKSFSGWKAMTKDVKGNKIWFYTNGTKSGWYKEGKQPKGWKKKVFKNKEKVTKLADNFEQYCNYGEVYMYAAWK